MSFVGTTALTQLITKIKQTFLPLAGGTMTGKIVRQGDMLVNSSDDSWNRLNGGTGYGNGATIILYGKNEASAPGRFTIGTNDGTNSPALIGDADGTLRWGGTPVIVGTEAEQTFTLTDRLTANASKDFTLSHAPKYWSVQFISGAGWGAMMVNVAGTNCRITNKNTGTLSADIKFKVNYIY